MSIDKILITGANRGLGLEFVKQFLLLPEAPSKIFATCRNPNQAEELLKIAESYPSVRILQLDVKDTASFSEFKQQLELEIDEGGLNLLINNAGIALWDTFQDVSKETMMENFEVNAVSPLLLTKELFPLLKMAADRSEGNLSCSRAAVVTITSKMGSIDDNTSGGIYPYRTSKAAINMIMKSLSVDLKPSGILTFVLHPGWVMTDMGGSNALIDPQTSVAGMIRVMLEAGNDHAGQFLDYDGKVVPW